MRFQIITIFLSCISAIPVFATPLRQEVASIYNQCEKQTDILDKAACMQVLRVYLQEKEDFYFGKDFFDDWRDLKYGEFSQYDEKYLKEIYKNERSSVQFYIANIPFIR